MGELVVFKSKLDESRPIVAVGASAEILFFTGVRIVRVEATEVPPKDRPRRPGSRSDGLRKRRERSS
jgi:hypothetical protein